jgi:hypothetical protein
MMWNVKRERERERERERGKKREGDIPTNQGLQGKYDKERFLLHFLKSLFDSLGPQPHK